jgi:hypothetical protein
VSAPPKFSVRSELLEMDGAPPPNVNVKLFIAGSLLVSALALVVIGRTLNLTGVVWYAVLASAGLDALIGLWLGARGLFNRS